MALVIIVEDGSNVADANSYVDAAYVAAYAESIESTVWKKNVSRQSAALIQATRYIDQKYRKDLPGAINQSSQSLLFPRGAFTDTQGRTHDAGVMPKALKDATAAAALYYLDGGLSLNADTGNNLKSSSVSVGGGAVSESVSYFEKGEIMAYPEVDGFMSTLIGKRASTSNSNNVPLIRG